MFPPSTGSSSLLLKPPSPSPYSSTFALGGRRSKRTSLAKLQCGEESHHSDRGGKENGSLQKQPEAVPAREKALQGVEEKNWLEDTGIHQSEISHVKWDKPIGLGPGVKPRMSVPGTDSEHRTQRFGARRLGRKTGRGRHTQSKSPNQGTPCWNASRCTNVEDIASEFRNLVAKATRP